MQISKGRMGAEGVKTGGSEWRERWKGRGLYGRFTEQMTYSLLKYDASNGYGNQSRRQAIDAMIEITPTVGRMQYPWMGYRTRYYAKKTSHPAIESGDGWTQGAPSGPLGYSTTMVGPTQMVVEYIAP